MSEPRAALIIGGAGLVGGHLAWRLLEAGQPVVVLDSLVRTGGEHVLRRLRAEHGEMLEVVVADLRDRTALRRAVARSARVYHLAAQVGMAASLVDPALDFDVNLRGTVDLLEELRRSDRAIPLVHASTTEVYGALKKLQLDELETRYTPVNDWIAVHGIDEHWPVEVNSPYGCSRAAADQYVLEYARWFRLPAVVARIGSIYGPEQPDSEEQGWITHFMRRALDRRPIAIDGNGKQVRDVLHVGDLVDALVRLMDGMDDLRGHVFNVGGGPDRAVSVCELVELMSEVLGEPVTVAHAGWREGDPRYLVSNTSKLEAMTGWQPTMELSEGLRELHAWLLAERRVSEASLSMSGTASG